ncbi:MAG: DNA (cytosine-5-)-methyltransferase [Anaerolineae bacterium]
MTDQLDSKTVAEYFAGIGLVRMGLETCGWRVVFANDFAEKKFELYKGFFPGADKHYVVDDIWNLDPRQIPEAMLATCSFPCIDLSLAGNRSGIHGEHSSAFWGFERILKAQDASAPPLVLVENVPGWLSSNKGADFRLTVKSLNDLGYACDVLTLDALRFTPQSRLRVFLVGARFPVLTHPDTLVKRPPSLLPDALRRSVLVNDDLKWFHLELPRPPALHASGLGNIIEDLEDSDPRWWGESEVTRHLAMMDEPHRRRVDMFLDQDRFTYRTFFRRRRKGQLRAEVRPDDLSGCLRTAVGGSGVQFLVRSGRGTIKMRAMTAREYARLQGVLDPYPIAANGVQALTGFGDAVCVPVISWIGQHVLNPLIENYMSREQQLQEAA